MQLGGAIALIFIGIDPGVTGGIAVIGEENDATAYPYTAQKLIELCKSLREQDKLNTTRVTVEKVHAMPKQGVASTFNFGAGYGKILGILEALELTPILVPPQTWKKYLGVTHDKQTSIRKAQFLFPNTSLLPTARSRVPNDGMAEALLIAYYSKCIQMDADVSSY